MNIKTLLFTCYAFSHIFVFLDGMQLENQPITQHFYISFTISNKESSESKLISGLSLLLQLYPQCDKGYDSLRKLHGIPEENSLKDEVYRLFEALMNEFNTVLKTSIKKIKHGFHDGFFETNNRKKPNMYIAFEVATPQELEKLEQSYKNVFKNKSIMYTTLSPINETNFNELTSEIFDQNGIFSFNLSDNVGIDKQKPFCFVDCIIL